MGYDPKFCLKMEAARSPRSAPTVTMKLAEYLCRRMYDVGCHHIFGVPGDFNLGLLDRVIESPVKYIGCCNELNAAYAADGCARIEGISACVTTYAVGELSAINGIAGSYAESVPVVKITGAPARRFYAEQVLLHHTLGDYKKPYHAYEQVTVDQCLLDDKRTAARSIDRCLQSCIMYKQPVYIVVPSDMVDEELTIEVDEAGKFFPIEIPRPVSNPSALREAVEELCLKITNARSPLFIPGVELIRRNYQDKFRQITEKCKIPYVTMLLAKGILNEDHPHFVGLYQGARSRDEVKRLVRGSDCIIIIGEKLSDLNTGGFTTCFNETNRVMINYASVVIKSHTFANVYIHDILDRLIEALPMRDHPPYEFVQAKHGCVIRPGLPRSPRPTDSREGHHLTMKSAFKIMSEHMEKDMVVIAETGSSMFATAETLLPPGAVYIGQTFYGSIGFSVGAAFGVCIALQAEGKGRKCLLVVGDGSFQLTCQEVSSMIRYKLNPTIILINNDGYLIERVITDNVYNDIQMWQYYRLPEIFGGKAGRRCITAAEFDEAMSQAQTEPDQLHFIEAVFDKWDCNILLKAAGRAMALNNNLKPSITESMLVTPTTTPSDSA